MDEFSTIWYKTKTDKERFKWFSTRKEAVAWMKRNYKNITPGYGSLFLQCLHQELSATKPI